MMCMHKISHPFCQLENMNIFGVSFLVLIPKAFCRKWVMIFLAKVFEACVFDTVVDYHFLL